MALGTLFADKKVLITGHTGFKGSWLTTWLLKLGAKVGGVSKDIPTRPSMFEVLELRDRITHYFADVRDLARMSEIIHDERPDFVFHLAAQAIVSQSYVDPVETISTNAIGTMNVLESLRQCKWPCAVVLITSDKCYDNVEWVWGYRETDRLGGKDAYSASKGAAELVIRCYLASFFNNDSPVRIGIGRAGNVIGGGDWAADRIVVDCMKAWSHKQAVKIRSPAATRPWQHVLEPLSGYLTLAAALTQSSRFHGEAFNFGPRAEQNRTVLELLRDLATEWGEDALVEVTGDASFHEASLLKLNCDKALSYLHWEPNLNYSQMIPLVSAWYSAFYRNRENLYERTVAQISDYEVLGREHRRVWASQ